MTLSRISYPPGELLPQPFCVSRAENDLLFTEDGRRFIDLLSGSGTVFLGHANPAIAARIREQLDAVWNTGAVPTRVRIEAESAMQGFLQPSQALASLYATGMEAAEFALRLTRHVTGRKAVVGFDGSMHGKSTGTAPLGWPNDLLSLPDWHRLPYLSTAGEDEILARVRRVLAEVPVSAVFLEPMLGSCGAHAPSPAFGAELSRLCASHGSLLVVDEVLTGFHRTGEAFLYPELGLRPDVVLIGKAMGNGFPVSGVVVERGRAIPPETLPGSTYADNPLAAAAVLGTLQEMREQDLPGRVAAVEQILRAGLDGLDRIGVTLRGKGALWTLELPPSMDVAAVTARIASRGVITSPTARFIRLLPAATCTPDHLARACEVIVGACREQAGSGR